MLSNHTLRVRTDYILCLFLHAHITKTYIHTVSDLAMSRVKFLGVETDYVGYFRGGGGGLRLFLRDSDFSGGGGVVEVFPKELKLF